MTDPAADPYIRAMFGENAAHAPLHMVVQQMGEGVVLFVGASRVEGAHPLTWGSPEPHQLFCGDAVFRPSAVLATRKLVGAGAAGILCSSMFSSTQDWEHLVVRP
jgi:hypothetical protein